MLKNILNLKEQPVLALFGDEPAVEAQGLLTSWSMAWPRTIARVWQMEGKVRKELKVLTPAQISNLPQYVQSFVNVEASSALPALTCPVVNYLLKVKIPGVTITPDIEKDLEWYLKLRSNQTNIVASALMELGFINNSFMHNDEDGSWFFENVKIFIKNAEDGVALLNDDTTTKNTIRFDIDKDTEERCLMEYCNDVKPYKREKFKKRLLYYNKQQRDLYISIRNEVANYIDRKQIQKGDDFHFQYEILNKYKGNIDDLISTKTIIHDDDLVKIIDDIFMEKIDDEIEINGWLNVRDESNVNNKSMFIDKNGNEDSCPHGKRTEHVVVLTIPRRPADDDDIGVALTDYAAAGKNSPFTCLLFC